MPAPISVAHVIDSGRALSWSEAVALAQSLAAASSQSVSRQPAADEVGALECFGIDENGAVVGLREACSPVSLSELALLLGRTIPAHPGDARMRAPAGVHFAIGRALGLVQAAPFESIDEFTTALRRFERGDRRALLREVFSRCLAPQRVERRVAAPPPDVLRRLLRETDHIRFVHAQQDGLRGRRWNSPSPDVLRRLLREADRELFEVSRARRIQRRRRVAAYGALSAAVLLALGAGLAERYHVFEPVLRTPRPAVRGAGILRAHAKQPIAPPGNPVGPNTAEVARSPLPQPAGGHAPLAANSARSVGSLSGRLIEALDAGDRPVFSPSFAASSSATFFDEGAGASSSLEQAHSGADGQLHVVSVVDDGARNYHPHFSPDGHMLAFDSDRDGIRGVYLASRDGHNVRRVSGTGYAAVPTWSPDGTGLAFIKAEPGRPNVWNLWWLNVGSGEIQRLTSYRYGQPWGASWFPDGRRICYAHEDQLLVLDLTTGRSRVYRSPRPGILVRTPAVSPDGRRVIFQLYRDGAWLLDVPGGSMRKVLDDPSAEEFAWAPDGNAVAFHSHRSGRWGLWFMMPST